MSKFADPPSGEFDGRVWCSSCRRERVKQKPGERALCTWCRLGEKIADADVTRRRVGVYCTADAHEKCPLGGARCGCDCHHPRRTPPKATKRAGGKAVVILDDHGRRLCPQGCGRILVKKNPHGPGRYPVSCGQCDPETLTACGRTTNLGPCTACGARPGTVCPRKNNL